MVDRPGIGVCVIFENSTVCDSRWIGLFVSVLAALCFLWGGWCGFLMDDFLLFVSVVFVGVLFSVFFAESLILAQDERWRRA